MNRGKVQQGSHNKRPGKVEIWKPFGATRSFYHQIPRHPRFSAVVCGPEALRNAVTLRKHRFTSGVREPTFWLAEMIQLPLAVEAAGEMSNISAG